MAVVAEKVVVGRKVANFPVAARDGGEARDDGDFDVGLDEKIMEIFDMIFILEKWIVEIMFFFADILEPFTALGVAVDIAAVIFAFKDENAFFRYDEEINFGSLAVVAGNVDVAQDLAFGDFELANKRMVYYSFAGTTDSAPLFGMFDFI